MSKIKFASESDLVDWYIENEISEDVDVFREFTVGNYGIIDVLTVNNKNKHITIYEFKNDTFKKAHMDQIMRYMKALSRIVERAAHEYSFSAVLICTDVGSGDELYYLDFTNSLRLEYVTIVGNTITVNHCSGGFQLTNEGNLTTPIQRIIESTDNYEETMEGAQNEGEA